MSEHTQDHDGDMEAVARKAMAGLNERNPDSRLLIMGNCRASDLYKLLDHYLRLVQATPTTAEPEPCKECVELAFEVDAWRTFAWALFQSQLREEDKA